LTLGSMLVRAPFAAVEGWAGPFYEPQRPHPLVDLAEARKRAASLEVLLARLVRARVRSLVVPPALGVALGVASTLMWPGQGAWLRAAVAVAIGVGAGVIDHVIGWSGWVTAGRSIVVLFALGLNVDAIAGAGRGLHDAALGLSGPDQLTFLGGLTKSGYPLVARVARTSWTLVPSSLRDEVV
jgi:hypothetical protein